MVRTKHRIGGYRVIAPIGAGGFATVYRALDEATGQEVAIKVLAENHSLVPDTRRRFVDEVELLSTIDSQRIAKIYDIGETETGQPYMVLELADRGDLRRRLEEIRGNHQVLNRADLTMLAHHLAESLTTLHRAEIIHRDVSPGNILIKSRRAPGERANRRPGEVTLLESGERFLLADLGHAKDMIRASGFTAGGGTRGYASPEQRDDVAIVDLRTDIFSATAVLEWAAHDGEYAKDLESFFDVGLAAEPDDRFNSMTEWHTAFSNALGAGRSDRPRRFFAFDRDEPVDLLSTTPPGERRRIDRKELAVAAGALLLGGALAFGVLIQIGGGTETESQSARLPLGDGSQAVTGQVDDEEGDPPPTLVVGEQSTVPARPVQEVSAEESSSSPEQQPATASIDGPTDESPVAGDLAVTGRARFPGEVGSVELLIKNLDTDRYWNPETIGFQESWYRATLPVDGDAADGSWQLTVPGDRLEPGSHLVRVWARSPDGSGDPKSDTVTVIVE